MQGKTLNDRSKKFGESSYRPSLKQADNIKDSQRSSVEIKGDVQYNDAHANLG